MRVFERLRHEILGAGCNRPQAVYVATWRERYRLMIEMRSIQRATRRRWWQEPPEDQPFALMLREEEKYAEIRLFGVPVMVKR